MTELTGEYGKETELEERQAELLLFKGMIGGLHPFEEDWMLVEYIKGLLDELLEYKRMMNVL